jgi:hypothetical protein
VLFALALGSMDEEEQRQRLLVKLLAPPAVAPLQPIPEPSPLVQWLAPPAVAPLDPIPEPSPLVQWLAPPAVAPLDPIPVRPRLARHLLAKAFARWLIYRAGVRAIERLTGVWLCLRAALPPPPGNL